MTVYLKQSTASQEVPLGYFVDSLDGNTEETGLTIANTDIKIWKTGATSLANKNSGGATHISNGVYYAVLDATDTDTLGPLVIFVHVSGALTVRLECCVLAANVYDSLIAASDKLETDVAQFGGTNGTFSSGRPEVNTTHAAGTAWASGAITAAVIATGAIDADAIADNAIDAGALAADCITAAKIANGAIDAATFAADVDAEILSYLVDDATRIDASALNTLSGHDPGETIMGATDTVVLTDGSLTATKIAANAITAAKVDTDVGTEIATAVWQTALPGTFTSGLAGAIVGDNLNATVSSRASQASVDTIDGIVDDILVDTGTTLQGELDGIQADTEDIQSRLPAALGANGNIKADVRDFNGTAGTFASGIPAVNTTQIEGSDATNQIRDSVVDDSTRIDASALNTLSSHDPGEAIMGATDAITVTTNNDKTGYRLSATGVDDIWDEAQSGHTSSGTFGKYLDQQLTTLLTTAMTEAYNTDGAAPTVAQALHVIMQRLTEFSISGTTITVKKLDGSTTGYTLTLNDATSPTSSTRAS